MNKLFLILCFCFGLNYISKGQEPMRVMPKEITIKSINNVVSYKDLNSPFTEKDYADLKVLKLVTYEENKVLPKEFLENVFRKAEHLDSLYIENFKLPYVNELNFSAEELIFLELKKTEIVKLPNSIRNLKKLEELVIVQNNELQLPKTLGKLKNLGVLTLFYNFYSWPKHLLKAKQLEFLQMINKSDNSYSIEIPKGITELTQLMYLDLSNFNMTRLPKGFHKLTNILSLNLNLNLLTTIPEDILALNELHELDVSNNPLDEDDFLKKMKNFPNNLTIIHVNFLNFSKSTYDLFDNDENKIYFYIDIINEDETTPLPPAISLETSPTRTE